MTWIVVLVAAGIVLLLMAGTAVIAGRTGRWAVVDVTWGLGFACVAVASALLSWALQGGDPWRTVCLGLLPTLWGLRLAAHIFGRGSGHEDPRYAELKQRGSLFRRVLLPQGLALWFISLPIQIGVGSAEPFAWLGRLGIVVWAIGFGFEAIGDRQLERFRADPANKGGVMDRGLWRYTRHPNYFGDATMWWGIWLIAADAGWAGLATVLSPIAMTFFIYQVTGVKLLERSMMQRPAYRRYAERTSIFLPLPPKRL